jgi:hypothetical protein
MTTADWVVVGLAACFGIYVYGRLIREFAPDLVRWRRNATCTASRPDYTKIAVLEYELLGIEPKPGTAAAFAVGMQRVGRALNGERVGVVDFPAGIRRSEIDTWCANYEHLAANTITVPKPDGSVELLYVDPSGRRSKTEEEP